MLVQHLAGNRVLAGETVTDIIERTDGVPLQEVHGRVALVLEQASSDLVERQPESI